MNLSIIEIINDEINNVLKTKLLIKNNINFNVEKSKNLSHGDYSTNVAMVCSKIVKKSPIEVANLITKNIKSKYFDKIEIAGPGFINFFLSNKYYIELLSLIQKEKDNYPIFKQKKDVIYNIEYVSANPTGALHIGHARNAAFGSVLTNVFKKYGISVDNEYYINDGGNQINLLGASVLIRYQQLLGKKIDFPKDDGYQGEEPKIAAKYLNKFYGDKFINTKINDMIISDKNDREIINTFSKTFLLNLIKDSLSNFKTNFDIYYPESEIYKNDLIRKAFIKMKKDLYISENALWLKTTKYGDDKDRVLIKSDNSLTYFAPDIAYHNEKSTRKNYKKLIDILGADHFGYINRLKASMKSLGNKDILDVVIMQMVRLIKDGKEYKMSKRTGQGLTLNDLINEIGVDRSRWFLISQSVNTHLDIDIDKVMNNDSTNSYFYVQYANARIYKILENYNDQLVISDEYEFNNKEREIMNHLSFLPNLITSISESYEVHKLISYLVELSSLFHSYYSENKILSDNKIETGKRVAISNSVRNVIMSCYKIIGIEPQNKI